MRVCLTGATGLIGGHLVRSLLEAGDRCIVLTRNAQRAGERLGSHERLELIEGDPTQPGPWQARCAGVDGIVNLAGANIFARRWSDEYKEEIRRSRVESTRRLAEAVRQAGERPLVFVQGSAIGYYGDRGDEELTEASSPGDDFLAHTCVEWEQAATPVVDAGVRLVIVRTGVVLARDGGALPTMLRPIRFFVGGPVGSGQQWVSWIHIADIVGIIRFALTTSSCTGPINGTAPHPVRNRELVRTLGELLGRPTFFRSPRFALRAALGEVADMLCGGQKVIPAKLLELNYPFRFPELRPALADLLGLTTAPQTEPSSPQHDSV